MVTSKRIPHPVPPSRRPIRAGPSGAGEAAVSTTVTKALGIVDVLASDSGRGLSLGELSSRLHMPKSTVHRYLATLHQLGLAERSGDDRFRLGTKVVELAGAYLANNDLRGQSSAILDQLAAEAEETVHLAVPSGAEVVYIAKVESKHALRMYSYIGARLPMYCTALGKAILACSSSDRLKEVLAGKLKPRTPNTITSAVALQAELKKVREQGYALDDEENEVGIRCVGAPIFDFTREVIGAVSISGPSNRMDRQQSDALAPAVREAALRISKRMGFPGS